MPVIRHEGVSQAAAELSAPAGAFTEWLGEAVHRQVSAPGASTVAGLPPRWGKRAYVEMRALMVPGQAEQSDAYKELCALIDEVTSGPIPVDATDAHICEMASRYASDCASVPVVEGLEGEAAFLRMVGICQVRGIEPPKQRDEGQAMARMLDAAWWRRSLRRTHGRIVEHAAQRLGFVSRQAGSYCSNETVKRRRGQVIRNEAALRAVSLRNNKNQTFTLADLAAKGMGNKSNRKDELMVRMAGCEDVSRELGHVGLFVTMTCPSKYHAVIAATGKTNPKYVMAGAPSPRQGQEYLNLVWSRIRAQNDRDGILPYGFRIAEPHHDGCPHWHMLVFLPEGQVEAFKKNLVDYAMAEDAYELSSDVAKEARLKVIEIDPAKGTAAGYIAKYVGKNIDDSQGVAFDEDGAVLVQEDSPLTLPCQRVDAWAAVWGIRQFQGVGMPPVTVWRELRRVAQVDDTAPEYLKRAAKACQRKESNFIDAETGKPGVIHAANFGDYIRAQGGVNVGRDYLIGIAHEVSQAKGRYGMVERAAPVGVYARQEAMPAVYPSVRYTWSRVGVALPRTGLNNCTAPAWVLADLGPTAPPWWLDEPAELAEFDDSEWFGSEEYAAAWVPPDEIEAHLIGAAIYAFETEAINKAAREARAH